MLYKGVAVVADLELARPVDLEIERVRLAVAFLDGDLEEPLALRDLHAHDAVGDGRHLQLRGLGLGSHGISSSAAASTETASRHQCS